MDVKKNMVWLGAFVILVLTLAGGVLPLQGAGVEDKLLDILKKEYAPIEKLLPPDVKVQPGFKEGVGPVIGNVQVVQGEVFVFHKGQSAAYKLVQDHPLYNGDTVVSGERARLNARLQDKSVFSLAPNSKLVLDESIYNVQKDERSSTLSLLFGKARFIVAKITGKSDYNIKTPTAVCGLRGSDLALSVAPEEEKISFFSRMYAVLSPVREAHAAPAAVLLTVLVTGPETTVGFAGTVGAMQVVGPVSVSAAAAGASAIAPVTVGLAAAGAALGAVGPGLAAISMPPGYR